MSRIVDIDLHPEFGIELALGVPYAYYHHMNGTLGHVTTSIGMSPFYYFANNVEEVYRSRTINNELAGLNSLPNNWIHHNAMSITGRDYNELSDIEKSNVNGVLDYTQWISPPYREYYGKNVSISQKTAIVTNKYNIEHGKLPRGYFDITCLNEMFKVLTNRGYKVIYKRERNLDKNLAYDENEYNSVASNLIDICGSLPHTSKILTDFELVELYSDLGVSTIDSEINLIKKTLPDVKYNAAQCMVMSSCELFISVCGGNGILSSMFGGNVIIYVHSGKELRHNYFGKNSYFRKLSDANIIPVCDPIINDYCVNDYDGIFSAIRSII